MLGSSGGIKRGSKVVNEKTRLTRDRSASPREDGERSVESSCDSLSLQEEMCGWGSWNPLKCQSLNNSRWVLFFFCTMACIQGMIMNGYTQTVVSTIERRYNLKSLATGFILSTNDMAICLSLIPISYIGATKNKCTLIATGAVIFAIGCLVFASPHFLNGSYHLSDSDNSVYDIHLCNNNITSQQREQQLCHAFQEKQPVGDIGSSLYMTIFIIGRFLQGVGTTTLFLLAVIYIDENTLPSTSSFYMGMFYGTSLLGPTVGYLLGAALLRLYVDFDRADDLGDLPIHSDNPLWVGAWWVGFLIGAVIALIVAIPISMYPKQLPSYGEINAKKKSEVHQANNDDNEAGRPGFGGTLGDLPRATCSLLQNGVYACIVLNNGFDAMIAVGLAAFFPKFLEAQLNLLPSAAAIAAAVIGIPSAGVGTILGGWIVKKYNMSCDQILSFCMWTTLLGILVLPAFLVPCDNVPYPGINSHYPIESSQTGSEGLNAKCNMQCSCIDEEYYPVCGSDDRQYFSPCHAGCKSEVFVDGEKVYTECGCIPPLAEGAQPLTLDNSSVVNSTYAEVGTCRFVCKARYLLLIGMFAIIFITCLPFVPSKAVLLRVVPSSQRSLAMGVRWIVSCLLGSIPGPILVGYLMDSTCVFWKQECDRSDHTCLLYDAANMRQFCFILALLFKFASLLFIFGACKLYKPPTTSHFEINGKEDYK